MKKKYRVKPEVPVAQKKKPVPAKPPAKAK